MSISIQTYLAVLTIGRAIQNMISSDSVDGYGEDFERSAEQT